MKTYFWLTLKEPIAFDSLNDAIQYLSGKVESVEHWIVGEVYGFVSDYKFIELYRGDSEGGIVSALLPDERVFVEDRLRETSYCCV